MKEAAFHGHYRFSAATLTQLLKFTPITARSVVATISPQHASSQ